MEGSSFFVYFLRWLHSLLQPSQVEDVSPHTTNRHTRRTRTIATTTAIAATLQSCHVIALYY